MNTIRLSMLLALAPVITYAVLEAFEFADFRRNVSEEFEWLERHRQVVDLSGDIATYRGERFLARSAAASIMETGEDLPTVVGRALEVLTPFASQASSVTWTEEWAQTLSTPPSASRPPLTEFTHFSAKLEELADLSRSLAQRRTSPLAADARLATAQHLTHEVSIRILDLAGQVQTLSIIPAMTIPANARHQQLRSLLRTVERHQNYLLAYLPLTSTQALTDELKTQAQAFIDLGATEDERIWTERFAEGNVMIDTARRLADAFYEDEFAALTALNGERYGRFVMRLLACMVIAALIVGIGAAVTRMKTRESRNRQFLRLAVETLGIGMWVRDLTTNEVIWSDELRNAIGLQPDDHAGLLMDYVHPENLPEAEQKLSELLAAEVPASRLFNTRLVKTDGSAAWYRAVVSTIEPAPGRPQLLGLLVDFDDQVQTAEQLSRALRELEARNDELQHFTRSTAHDLLEPIRNMYAFSDVLLTDLDGEVSDQSLKHLRFLNEGALRARQMLEQLQIYMSITPTDQEPQAVDLNTVATLAIDQCHLQISKTNASVTADPLPTVTAHPQPLLSVFANLISNALKYAKSNEPPVVQIRCDTHQGHLVFSDNGIGIEPEFLETVLEPFKRLHTRAEIPGSGLGLSLCKRAIEHAGGRMWVESEYGVGTQIYVALPGLAKVS